MPANLPTEPVVDYCFGPYRFDGRLRRLFKDGEAVVLTPKAADTLAALIERAGRVVEKDELLHAVWDEIVVGDDTLAQNISTLRRVLGDDPNRPVYIATVPRRGYKFVAPIRSVPSPDAGTPAREGRRSTPSMTRRIALIAAALLACAAGALLMQRLWVDSEPPRSSVQFTIAEPESGRFSSSGGMLTVSPDGTYLAFVVTDDAGSPSLWLRPLASTVARPLQGTEGADAPFWSPDSRTVAFFAHRRLKAVDVMSGAVRVIASLTSSRSMGATWSLKKLREVEGAFSPAGLFVDAQGVGGRRPA